MGNLTDEQIQKLTKEERETQAAVELRLAQSFPKELGRHGDAWLRDELDGGDVKDMLDDASESFAIQARSAGVSGSM